MRGLEGGTRKSIVLRRQLVGCLPYQEVVIQDIIFRTENILFRKEKYSRAAKRP